MALLEDGGGQKNVSTVPFEDFSMRSKSVCLTAGRAVLSMMEALS